MEENDNKITIKNVNAKIIWEIYNYSIRANQMKPCEVIESPEFEIVGPNGDKTKWFTEIYPNGFIMKEHVEIYVKLAESEEAKVPARIELAIMDSKGEEKHKTVYTTVYGGLAHLAYPNLIKRNLLMDEENGLLTNGKLTIVCHIDIDSAVSPVNHIQIPPCQLIADFANLLDGGILVDFVLISSDNKEFKVHKNVLSCRSHVFAAMFRQKGMIEAQNNRVKIEDIRGDVLQKMLDFIYTGNALNIDAMAKELLTAADKYQIERLKVLCERSLILSLNIGNACELLVLADLHSAAYLKLEIVQFITSHADEVIKSDGWQILSNGHSRLLAQLFEAMASERRNLNCFCPI